MKRDLCIGAGLCMTFNASGHSDKLNKTRYVIKTSTTGVCLNEDKNATKGSFLEFTKASLTEYDGDTLKVYFAGRRDLTADEQRIRDNVPSKRPENKERAEFEALSDGSGLFYADQHYYKENDSEYLAGHTTSKGMRYDYNTQAIQDDKIKGELSLSYKIIK